jgi:signal peptidase I
MKRCTHCGQENDEAASCCTSCGTDGFGEPAAPAAAKGPSKGKPWLGVVLSLLVPGFGMLRGGKPGLALAWFVGLELGSALVAAAMALERIPFGLGVAAGALWLAAELCMLCQSCRPGRMTGKLWAAFAGMLVLTQALPCPPELVAHPFKMPSGSMRPTLQGGSGQDDHLVVDRLTYRVSSPRRGDLVVFHTEGIPGLPQDQFYVKRIIGLPGERLEIRDGFVFADDIRLTDRDGIPPIHYVTREAVEGSKPTSSASYVVEKESYFVLGDNSKASLDSRHFGSVPRENIYGKVTGIYYPFSRAGRPRYVGEPGAPANANQPIRSETSQTSSAAGSLR